MRDDDAAAPSEGDTNLSARRASWQTANVGPAGARLLARDDAVFLRQALSTPCLGHGAARGRHLDGGRRRPSVH